MSVLAGEGSDFQGNVVCIAVVIFRTHWSHLGASLG